MSGSPLGGFCRASLSAARSHVGVRRLANVCSTQMVTSGYALGGANRSIDRVRVQ